MASEQTTKRRIKVLQVMESVVGGTRKHLLSILGGIDRTRFEVEVACPRVRHTARDDTSFYDEAVALDIPVHIVDMRRSISLTSDLRATAALYQLIRREQYDIVHARSSKGGILGRTAAKLCKSKTVYTPHGFYFLNTDSAVQRRFYVGLEQVAGRLTDRLIAVSDSEAQEAIKNRIVPPQKIEVIPNAIDSQSVRFDPDMRRQVRRKFDIGDDALVLGTASRFIPQKDPATMVRAVRQVVDIFPQVQFIWCGEGELRAETETLAEQLNLTPNFHFLGFRKDVLDIVNSFDIFVLSSIFEGLPWVLLEAMALERPTVATNVVGNQDVIRDSWNGLLVPPRNPTALADAICRLITNESLRSSTSKNGREWVMENFSLQMLIQRTEDVYYSLMNTAR